MPRHDYRCEDCGYVFERKVAPEDLDHPQLCPSCWGLSVKQPAAPSFKIEGYSARNGYSSK